MKLLVHKGRTSLLARVFIRDSSSTIGAGLVGLTSASSGLVCYRMRDDDGNAGATQLALSAGTRGTWSSGGFVEKDAANAPGWYELGIDNAGLAAGSETADYHLKGATNMAPTPVEIQLVAYDPQDTVRMGLTALPNAAANAAGGLPISTAGALDMDDLAADVDAVETRVILALPAAAPQAAGGLVTSTAGSFDLDEMNVDIEAIQAKTDNLPASPAAVGSAMTLTSGERTAIADAHLDRDMSVGADSGSPSVRTVRQALRALRNKNDTTVGTVYKEDDATASWTYALTTSAGALGITVIDPAGP